ncbi:MAG TPA: response regulator transcription factor [Chloroflexota bacterium]|nr:response regulator transcription factor [Chloroflexota bacterium]
MLKDLRILVVEDDLQMAEIIEWNLLSAGYPVTVVNDGVAALRKFDEERPSIVTIDLNVPEVSGFRLVKLFKRYAQDIPVIVVTAASFEEAEDIARDGADDFLAKPFDPRQLIKKVEYHLERVRRADGAVLVPASPPVASPRQPLEVG